MKCMNIANSIRIDSLFVVVVLPSYGSYIGFWPISMNSGKVTRSGGLSSLLEVNTKRNLQQKSEKIMVHFRNKLYSFIISYIIFC